MEEIAGQLKKLRFRKKFIGGVGEADVWKQLELLQGDYRAAFEAQETYFQALLDERGDMIDRLGSPLVGAGGGGGGTGE